MLRIKFLHCRHLTRIYLVFRAWSTTPAFSYFQADALMVWLSSYETMDSFPFSFYQMIDSFFCSCRLCLMMPKIRISKSKCSKLHDIIKNSKSKNYLFYIIPINCFKLETEIVVKNRNQNEKISGDLKSGFQEMRIARKLWKISGCSTGVKTFVLLTRATNSYLHGTKILNFYISFSITRFNSEFKRWINLLLPITITYSIYSNLLICYFLIYEISKPMKRLIFSLKSFK